MNFVAIDVETANADLSTICQIGVASFERGALQSEWSSLVDPEDYFESRNVAIHGIEPPMVEGAPKLPEIADVLCRLLNDRVTVCRTGFDRTALGQAFSKYRIPPLHTTWLDSARVVRRTWKDCASRGFGLSDICEKLGYEYRAHDALEDAKAAGHVVLAAVCESGIDI